MTIPRIPGVFDALGQGLMGGLNAYNFEKRQQVDDARAGYATLLSLINQGKVDPATLANPAMQATAVAGRLPPIQAEQIIPSYAAEQARRTARAGEALEPGSLKEQVFYKIPGLPSEVGEEELKGYITAIQNEAARDPDGAVARLLAGLPAPGVARARETVQQANVARPEFENAAFDFVMQAGLSAPFAKEGAVIDVPTLAAAAKQAAQADPQYTALVESGQLSDEIFATAAQRYLGMNEEMRLKWGEIAARRAALEREARMMFGTVDKSYNEEIQRQQAIIEEAKLTSSDLAFLDSAKKRAAAGKSDYDQFEIDALRKVALIENAQAQIDAINKQRGQYRGQFVREKAPDVPTGNVNPAKVRAAILRIRRKEGGATTDAVKTSPSFTEEEKAEILKAFGITYQAARPHTPPR